ncbi:single-strand binding protein, putative [Babesia ovata]|uniref:Single-strand binding protein, putative n=1 Tax=Babesia ovata TaxID=189622 RepID=A0A2H6KJ97_9APIC|nr:single-strand binding protein, putative [Babesia ovata]GBE63073.1 single-strand binding protein, putative [Babesia ovata]
MINDVTGQYSDPYNNHVIFVDPRQYKRICIRREQRDRVFRRRGRPRPRYLPVAPLAEDNSLKRQRDGYDSPGKAKKNSRRPYPASYFYPPPLNEMSGDSDRVSSKAPRCEDRNAVQFSDIAGMMAENGYYGNHAGSANSGSTSRSHGSEYSPRKERNSYVEPITRENPTSSGFVAHGDSYFVAHNQATVEASASHDGLQPEACGHVDSYAQLHARSVNRGYMYQRSSGTSDSYSSTSSASSYSAVYDGRVMPNGSSSAAPPVNYYPAAGGAGNQNVMSADSYAGGKTGNVAYSRGVYSAETYSGESCCSEGYSRDDYGQGSDGVDYYAANINGRCNRMAGRHNGRYGDGGNAGLGVGGPAALAPGGDINCAYAQNVVGGPVVYPATIMSRGAAQPVLQGPMYSEYVYVAGADAKV